MKDLIKFIKSSGVYFVGTVLTKLVSFLLLPLYTAYISPAGYGTYDLYNSYMMFFCSVLFLDIWAGIMRFMYDYSGEERKKPINCGFTIFVCSSLLFAILLAVLSPILKIENPVLIYMCGLLMNVQSLVGYVTRGYGKNVLYTASGLIGSITTTVFNIILLVYFHMDFTALFWASCVGYIVSILIMKIGLREKQLYSFKYFDKKIFKELLLFSLPLCLNSVAYWFLTSYNKIAIDSVLGPEANGYYAIAGRFGSMITLFTTCFQMAWQEMAYSKSAKEDDLGDFYSTAINTYMKSMGGGLVMLIPFIFIIYPVMVNESYGIGKELIPLYLLGTIFSTIASFLGNIFSAIKKNQLLFRTMLYGSVVNVVGIHLLLPALGIQASNIALALGFLVLCLTRIRLLKKYMNLKIDFLSVGLLTFAFVGVYYCYSSGNIGLNIVAFLLAMLFFLYLFKDFIVTILKKIKDRVS